MTGRKSLHRVHRIVLERDGPYCRYCGKAATDVGWRLDVRGRARVWTPGLQLDHVIPHAHGGGDEPENLVLACADCNRRRGTKAQPQLRSACPFRLGPLAHTLIADYRPTSDSYV